MPTPKPHHQLVLWAAEHAPETDLNLAVEVCPEAFNKLLREGMMQWNDDPESRLIGRRYGEIPLEDGRFVRVRDRAESAEVVLFWEGEPFYTLELTEHQQLAFAAMVEAARKEQQTS